MFDSKDKDFFSIDHKPVLSDAQCIAAMCGSNLKKRKRENIPTGAILEEFLAYKRMKNDWTAKIEIARPLNEYAENSILLHMQSIPERVKNRSKNLEYPVVPLLSASYIDKLLREGHTFKARKNGIIATARICYNQQYGAAPCAASYIPENVHGICPREFLFPDEMEKLESEGINPSIHRTCILCKVFESSLIHAHQGVLKLANSIDTPLFRVPVECADGYKTEFAQTCKIGKRVESTDPILKFKAMRYHIIPDPHCPSIFLFDQSEMLSEPRVIAPLNDLEKYSMEYLHNMGKTAQIMYSNEEWHSCPLRNFP